MIGLLVLIPTRRLFLGGWTTGPLAIYFLGMVTLGLLVAELRGPARYLVPILVVGYIAPFVTVREGLNRIRDRLSGGSGPPPPVNGGPGDTPTGPKSAPRNVTPPEAHPPESTH